MTSDAWSTVSLVLGILAGLAGLRGVWVARASVQPAPLQPMLWRAGEAEEEETRRAQEAGRVQKATTVWGVLAAVLGVLAGVAGFVGG